MFNPEINSLSDLFVDLPKETEPYVVHIVNMWPLLEDISRTVAANSFNPVKQNKAYESILFHIKYLLNQVHE